MPGSLHLCASYGLVLLPQNNCSHIWQLAKFNQSAKLAFLHSKTSATWNKVLTDSRRRYCPAAEEEWDNLPLGFTDISWQQRHGKTPKLWVYSRLWKAVSSSRRMLLPIFLMPNLLLLPQCLFSILKSHFLPMEDMILHSFSSSVSSSSHSTFPYTSKQSTNHEGWLHHQTFLSKHSIFLTVFKNQNNFLLKAEISEEREAIAHNTGRWVRSLKSIPQIHRSWQLQLHGLLRLE